ncbi:MAG TPA: FISUMP domain-containing protein [Bacteroidales bacterium]|nr:FISUMP domain-containing protein [Bacteroidales bacterium]
MKKPGTFLITSAIVILLFGQGIIPVNELMVRAVTQTTAATAAQSKPAPAQKQTAPAQKQTAPAQKQATPAQKQATPVQKQTTPAQKQAAPAQKQTTPAQKQAAPAQKQAPPAQKQTTPAQKQTTPAQKQTPPAQKQTTPAQKQATPAQKQAAPTQKKSPATEPGTKTAIKTPETGIVRIGSQVWAATNLNVVTFRNGDTIPEARTNEEWVAAGKSEKPAWCYYNNDPKNGSKYGKLYNWFAINDPRGLAPEGWSLPDASDWAQLAGYLGGAGTAGNKLKSSSGWADGYIGSNESGFSGLPGGYRVENGNFHNLGSIATWWSITEGKPGTAIDHYIGQRGSLERSHNPKQVGESVRCIRKQ